MVPPPEAQHRRWLVIWNSQTTKVISNFFARGIVYICGMVCSLAGWVTSWNLWLYCPGMCQEHQRMDASARGFEEYIGELGESIRILQLDINYIDALLAVYLKSSKKWWWLWASVNLDILLLYSEISSRKHGWRRVGEKFYSDPGLWLRKRNNSKVGVTETTLTRLRVSLMTKKNFHGSREH